MARPLAHMHPQISQVALLNGNEGKLRVAIVGGGLAGLSAARSLQEKNVDYVLFEGTDRVGGRVRNTPYRSGFIQFGAEFVNGKSNPVYEIASRLNLLDRYMDDEELFTDDVLYACGQSDISKNDIKEFQTFTKPLSDKFEEAGKEEMTPSVAEMFYTEYEEWLQQDSQRLARRRIFDRLSKLYQTYYENEWSAPFDQLAVLNLERWDDFSDAFASFTLGPQGFKAILDDIKSFVNEKNIRYNSIVQNIDYSGSKVRLTVTSPCVSDQPLLFDYVIVTCPIGHLKRFSFSLFTPPLPKVKQQAIENIGMGNMMKVFLEYDEEWWPEEVGSILALPETTNNNNSISNFNYNEHEKENSKPMNWKKVKEAEKTVKIKETLRVFQPLEWESNMLVCWLAGDGPALISQIDDTKLAEIVTERLREALVDQKIPAPKRIQRMDWYSHPLFHGSYSFLTPEAAAMGDPYAIMGEPVKNFTSGKTQVLFAGEATHSNLYQTTSGAYLSGQREADRICRLENLI
ncbi:unnamed protein product, partial [Mesorhabditis belari]|uniref:Amine oxidase domain-containing protein n=1 Tax=Mesorhabditis belari TaxID=2138241 RepID=A0AAF3FCU7_9BILA